MHTIFCKRHSCVLSKKTPQRRLVRKVRFKVGSINSIFYFLHKAAEPFNCLEQDNLA